MKKQFVYSTIIALLIFLGCAKYQKSRASSTSLVDRTTISTAKAFFNSQILPKSNGENTPFSGILKTVVWDKAYIQKLSIGTAVIVPINCPPNFHIQSNLMDIDAKIPLDHLMKLVIYKDPLSNFQARVVTFFPDANYIASNQSKITGAVSVSD